MGNKQSNGGNNQPVWAREEFWPNSNDTTEELERKRDRNLQAATAEIVSDIIYPDRIEDGDLTEYQSNATRANDIIEEKKKE